MTVNVGEGTPVTGNFANINWGNGPFFLKSEIDPQGGFNYSITGIQQLLSVPYALYASQAGNVPAFAIIPTDSGYVISITEAGSAPQAFFLRQGTPGPQGPQGEPGNNGADGNGIASIAKTGEAGLLLLPTRMATVMLLSKSERSVGWPKTCAAPSMLTAAPSPPIFLMELVQ